MSESNRLEELFPGSNEELTACIGWLNRAGGQLDILLKRLGYFLSEREHAPSSANSAMQSCRQSASLVFDRLKEFPELDCFSSIVHEQLCTAVFPMLSALQKIREANSGEIFDEAIDYFLAVSKRYQSESKAALQGCIATLAARKPQKRSTVKGEARAKIIGGLNTHHEYDNGSCTNLTPIQVGEFARKINVSKSSVSAFLKAEFDEPGYSKYKIACKNAEILGQSLRILNGELTPSILFNQLGDDDGNLANE